MPHRVMSDTIFAQASGAGRAGVAILRLSGPAAGDALLKLGHLRVLPPARRATITALFDPADGSLIDRALALWFPAPASFTGEDVVELHVHGGRAVIAAVSEALAAQPGLRLAEPGEFTRRAFENGKLDLTAAEGVADLISADTAAQRRQALRQMDGQLGALYEIWRVDLFGALARLEADIDFPDEDLPGSLPQQVRAGVAALLGQIESHLKDNRRGERLRDGFSLVLLGAPNVGKSSLLNALARRDAAIVSSIAGTTRDVVEVMLDLDGFPVILADTAGLRPVEDEIEQEGIRRALLRASQADLKLLLVDAGVWPELPPDVKRLADSESIIIPTKIDLYPRLDVSAIPGQKIYPVSIVTGEGLDRLQQALAEIVRTKLEAGATPGLTRIRHRRALEDCVSCLRRFLDTAEAELAAEDVRLAARCLGRITGRVDVEDILDIVFSEFCIGK